MVDAIAQLDLRGFYAQPETRGGVVYAPKVILGLLFYAYANGMFNAGKIEEATCQSIPLRYIAGGLHPDHGTIAEFRERFGPEIRESFVQILLLARTVGALKVGNIGLNGSKIHVDTPKGKAVTYKGLLELETRLRQKVERLLALGEQADRAGSPKDLVIEEGSAWREDRRASLAKARAILEAWAQKRYAAGVAEREGEMRAREEEVRQTGREPGGRAAQPPTPGSNGKYKGGLESHAVKNSDGGYKYSCRTCLVRRRCIDTKGLGPGIKLAIAHMFENRTDTLETWAKLQQDCLLVQEERRREASKAGQESALMRRLRQMQGASNGTSTAKPQHSTPWTPPAFPVARPSSDNGASTFRTKDLVPRPERKAATSPPLFSGPPARSSKAVPHGITCLSTRRVVRLPDRGEVVLGRLESNFSNPPDVDLAPDDGEIPSVSRRHARITGRGGQHWIEDMGSANGTYLNGYRLALGESVRLVPGDRVLLGRCRMAYTPLSEQAEQPAIAQGGQPIERPKRRDGVFLKGLLAQPAYG